MNDMPWRFQKGQTPHNKRHGMSHTRTHNAWVDMKTRCFNRKHNRFVHYGGRGITICEMWMSFDNFYSDMGECPDGMSLDRIDVNGNYCPENCRWATDLQQGEHRSNSVIITHNGKTQHLKAWARELGMPYLALCKRLYRGWNHYDTLTIPLKSKPSTAQPQLSGV